MKAQSNVNSGNRKNSTLQEQGVSNNGAIIVFTILEGSL